MQCNPHKLPFLCFRLILMHTLPRPHIKTLLLALTLALCSAPAFGKKVAGVELADSISIGSNELSLNGAGIRKKLFIKLYVGSLYLAESGNDGNTIITADKPMALRLNILSDLLTQKKMVKALKDGFNNSTNGNTAPIQAEIDQMIALMQEKIRPGDSYTLAYEPGIGTRVSRNDEEMSVIAGLAFKQALFGIWLSDKPAQASLKKAMLSK